MTDLDQTLTDGLQNDRYVKATQLVEDFEESVFEMLGTTLDEIMSGEHSELFDQEQGHDRGRYRNPGATYGTLRLEGTMRKTDSDDNTLMLNLGLEWVEPEAQDIQEWPDPLLCYVYYKIKFAPYDPFQAVQEETAETAAWDAVQGGDEQWDSGDRVAPGIFYVPVSSGEDIEEGLSLLSNHFVTFGQRLVG